MMIGAEMATNRYLVYWRIYDDLTIYLYHLQYIPVITLTS